MGEMTTLERIACAISGAPFPTANSLRKAKAALEAFRDPSTTILAAGHSVMPAYDPDEDDVRSVINAAVDAALAEGETAT